MQEINNNNNNSAPASIYKPEIESNLLYITKLLQFEEPLTLHDIFSYIEGCKNDRPIPASLNPLLKISVFFRRKKKQTYKLKVFNPKKKLKCAIKSIRGSEYQKLGVQVHINMTVLTLSCHACSLSI